MGTGDRHDKGVMPEHDESSPKSRKRSKPVTALAWVIAALLAPLCLAWVAGQWVYWFDILASQQMLIGWVALALGSLMLAVRRWVAGSVCVVLAMVSLYPVFVGRVWLLPSIDLEHKPDGVIRVVSFNVLPLNELWRTNFETILRYDADIFVLLEAHPELSRSIRKRGLLETTPYTSWGHRPWVDQETSSAFILSQWPAEVIRAKDDDGLGQHHLYMRVESPLGKVIIGLMHPASPRTQARWIRGNKVIESQASVSQQIQAMTGLPVLVGADLNAGPAQRRARTLRKAGLRMSKPVLHPDGSFPANTTIPSVLRIQLDDVWSLGNIQPVAWEMIELKGSDHQAIIVDFKVVGRPDS